MGTKEKTSKLYLVTKKIDNFYKTKWAFIVFISLSYAATAIQVVLFSIGKMTMNDISVGDPNEWIFWFLTIISVTSSTCMLTANVLVQRENKNFIWFSLISISFGLINMIFTLSFFVALTQFITLGLVLHRYSLWKKHDQLSVRAKASKRTILLILVIWMTYVIFAVVIVSIWGQQIYDPNLTGNKPVWTWWLDAIGSSSIILSMLLINVKNKWGFLAQSIGPLTGVAIYAEAHQITMVINLLILSMMAFTTFLSWVSRDIEEKNKKMNS